MSSTSVGTGFVNQELCGEGFRDMRGLINCKGCGLKFRSGSEFGKHAKGVEERKSNRQEIAEQMMVKGRQGDGRDNIANKRDTAMQRAGKPEAVEELRGEKARMHVRMPGQAAVGIPGQETVGMQGLISNTSECISGVKLPPGQTRVTPGLANTGMSRSTEPKMSVARSSPSGVSGHAATSVSVYRQACAASSSGPGRGSAGVPEYMVQEVGNMGEIPTHTIRNMQYNTNVPTILPTPHPVVTQQILQQQQQLALQQEQQQQLIILKQQLQQQQQNPSIQALPSQAPHFPVLPPQQAHVSDRDRQIALLEKELRIQKMMLEVERREALLREQATLLSAQAERLKQEQLQALRYRAPAGGTEVLAKCGGSEQDDGGQSLEKARLGQMYEVMEMSRKEELRKMEADQKNVHIEIKNSPHDKINVGASKRKSGKLQKSELSFMEEKSKDTKDVEDDVFPSKPGFPFDDSDVLEVDDAEEQLKILEAIKIRNEEKKKEEELTMKLITKLSIDESEELTPQSLDDAWPDLSEAVPCAGETAREKIERLKRMAERRGMCVNSSSSRKTRNLAHEKIDLQ